MIRMVVSLRNDREPDGRFVRSGPLDPMSAACWYVQKVTGPHLDWLLISSNRILAAPVSSMTHFVLRLIAPESRWRSVTRETIRSMRKLADACSVSISFFREVRRDPGEKIVQWNHPAEAGVVDAQSCNPLIFVAIHCLCR